MPFHIEIDKNRLTARVSYEKSGNKEEMPTKQNLIDLVNNKAIKGVDPLVIDEAYGKFIKQGKLKGFLIAKGTPPAPPKDGEVKWLFDTESGEIHAGKTKEAGGIDYRERISFVGVNEDQLIGEWIPPVSGKPGQDVFGEPVQPSTPKQNNIIAGKNIRLSDDGTKCYSTIKGHVFSSGFRVSVDKVYKVSGNVDFNTGNVHYPGNVLVSGHVKEGFIVEAEGDVMVDGLIENAEVRATGNIVVKRGILNNSRVKAEGDLQAEFIQDSRVDCGGKVIIKKSIVKSIVNAKQDIMVTSMKGSSGIVGGEVSAGNDINTYCIGSEIGVETKVCAGNNRKLFLHLRQLVSHGMKIKANIVRFNYILKLMKAKTGNKISNMEKRKQEKAEKILNEQKHELDSVIQELQGVKSEASKFTAAKVKAFGTTNEGAIIGILGMMKQVEQSVKNNLFYFDNEKNLVTSRKMT